MPFVMLRTPAESASFTDNVCMGQLHGQTHVQLFLLLTSQRTVIDCKKHAWFCLCKGQDFRNPRVGLPPKSWATVRTAGLYKLERNCCGAMMTVRAVKCQVHTLILRRSAVQQEHTYSCRRSCNRCETCIVIAQSTAGQKHHVYV